MSARTRTAIAELERLASRPRALRRRVEYQSQRGQALKLRICRRLRPLRRECEAADIIAQRAGRGDKGRTADGNALHVLRHDTDRTVCMAV
eukprot:1842545-Prymnesium_polylepis.1